MECSVQRTVIVNISFVKEELEGGVAAGCKILAPLAPSNKLFIYAELSKVLARLGVIPCQPPGAKVPIDSQVLGRAHLLGQKQWLQSELLLVYWCEGICGFRFHALSPQAPVRESATGVTSTT